MSDTVFDFAFNARFSAGANRFTLNISCRSDAARLAVVGPSGAGKSLMLQLLAGLLQVADKASKGEKIEINDMFAGFRVHSRQLVQVGVLYMVGMLIILMVAAMISGGSMASGLLLGQMAGAGMAVGGMVLALLVSLVLSVPLMMGVWFAPALVLFNGMEAVDALKASFAANLKNLVPMLVYGIFVLVLAFFAALPAGLGFLVLAPVLAGSIYAQYRDLFVAH